KRPRRRPGCGASVGPPPGPCRRAFPSGFQRRLHPVPPQSAAATARPRAGSAPARPPIGGGSAPPRRFVHYSCLVLGAALRELYLLSTPAGLDSANFMDAETRIDCPRSGPGLLRELVAGENVGVVCRPRGLYQVDWIPEDQARTTTMTTAR